MSESSAFDRALASLHNAVLDDAHWPMTSALIAEACGTIGNCLTFAKGRYPNYFIRFYFRGERDVDFEHWYFDGYYARDERVPRLIGLPDSKLVHATDLYTHEELKTSAAYHEACPEVTPRTASTCVWMGRADRGLPGPPPIPSTPMTGRRRRLTSSGTFCPICVSTCASDGLLLTPGAWRVPHRASGQDRIRRHSTGLARADRRGE